MIHFDTSFLIQATLAGSPAHARFRAWAAASETFGISTIAWTEYLCGPLDATAQFLAEQMFPHPVPFIRSDALLAARLFNQSGRRSRTLADCMIAAIAIRSDASLATLNPADFKPLIPFGLSLI